MKITAENILRIVDRFPDITFSHAAEDLLCYGFDASAIENCPSAIIWPRNTEDVVKVMKYAYEREIPVVPRGAGTGMTAGAVPSHGSIVMSFERMKKILEIDTQNMNIICEPGTINGKIQRELEWKGLFYPPDPASMNFCTIGGNVAENAGGPRALKYGVTRDYVMEIEAVLPNGEMLTAGVKTTKGVVGYDLVRLLTGSEGTLAVFTKIRLKVLPLPEDIVTLLALFTSLESAGDAVTHIISSRIIPRTLEFMDRQAIAVVENYRPIGLPENAEALLLIELDGYPATITREAEKVIDLCTKFGAEIKMAKDDFARNDLWASRRAVSPALYRIKPTKINEDIVVPRMKITEMLVRLRALSEKSGITIVSFGHAGDGNIHVNIMVDRSDQDEFQRGVALIEQIFRETLDLGGTISGEHGIGLTKAKYLTMELSHREISLMSSIKKVFDPKNILNPGKIFS